MESGGTHDLPPALPIQKRSGDRCIASSIFRSRSVDVAARDDDHPELQ